MDAIRQQLSKPLLAAVLGLIVGLVLGLLYAWMIAPVEWTDAGPADLSTAQQEEYLRMAIEAYRSNPNPAVAQARYQALGEDAHPVLAAIQLNPQTLSPQDVNNFTTVVVPGAAGNIPVDTPAPGIVTTPEVGGAVVTPGIVPTEAPAVKEPSFLARIMPFFCAALLLLVAVLAVFYFLRNRAPSGGGIMTPAQQAQQAARSATLTQYDEPPMAQFMASYKLGDDLFDDSFSIDTPAGEFMGECGVGISDTIGVGDPKKVSAFEVWLFDKNDIQTVTRVFLSTHAFQDDGVQQKLRAKGDTLLATPGAEAVLETQTLQLIARVIDMAYGEGALPSESFFDRFIIELAIWPKNG